MILVDTSVILDIINAKKIPDRTNKILTENKLAISSVTQAEIELGFFFSRSQKNLKAKKIYDDFISEKNLIILPFDSRTATEYAKIQAMLLQKGHALSRFDTCIAATAIVHKLPVLTTDDDFKRVKGLRFAR